MGVYGSVWECMGVYGSIWECMGVYGSVWECTGVLGSVWECTGIAPRHRHSTIGTPPTASTTSTPDNDCLRPSIRINVDECNGIWVSVVEFGSKGGYTRYRWREFERVLGHHRSKVNQRGRDKHRCAHNALI
jgi:hypothetical protein